VIHRKKKPCKGEVCDRIDYIVGRGLCGRCYAKYLNNKQREKKEKARAGLQQRQGEDKSELDIFNEIWEERPHKSEVDGTLLFPKGHKLWHWQFSHLLPKGAYPSSKFDKDNIVLMTWAQHQLWEFHPHKLREKEDW
jgi:hypothetical protein